LNDQHHNPVEPAAAIRCEEMESLAILYSSDELDAAVRSALQDHLARCAPCAGIVSREMRLRHTLATAEQPADALDPSGLLLAQCRSDLAESLDDRQNPAKQSSWLAILSPVSWWRAFRETLLYHPAMSMGALVIVGFLAGVAGQRLPQTATRVPNRPAMVVSSTPQLTMQQLQSAASANIAWVTPTGTQPPAVQVQLMSPNPMSIVGPPDDAEVQRALTLVLQYGQQFEPAVRLDSLDVLRTRAADPEVSRVLRAAARSDQNAGVRMKALECLQDFVRVAAVRHTVLEALQNDSNSGVRIAAMNLLTQSFSADDPSPASDQELVSVLRDRVHNDPNHFIRLLRGPPLREIGADNLP